MLTPEDQEPRLPVDDRKTWAVLGLLMALWLLLVALPIYSWLFA